MATDQEFFDALKVENEKTVAKEGRPAIDRGIGYKLLGEKKQDGTPKFSTKYIMRVCHCSSRLVRLMRKEMLDKGIVTKEEVDLSKLDYDARSFDEECIEVRGLSFRDWMISKERENGKAIFSFCQKVWSNVWKKPYLYEITDASNNRAEQLAQEFLKVFGEDIKRIRARITSIRRFFSFMKREDINDMYLRLTESKHPRAMREVPSLAFVDSPLQIQEAIDEMKARFGLEGELLVMLKIVTQMRTGQADEKRELWGIQVGEPDHSFLLMPSGVEGQIVFQIHAKMNETWTINFLPKQVKQKLFDLYQTRKKGENSFS